MVVQAATRCSVTEFDEFARLPENVNRSLEYIGGEIVEMVANNYSSEVAVRIATFIGMYLIQNRIGRITGADGGYCVSGERYIPDVAFVSFQKQPEPCHAAYNPNAPDLAVEVLSPQNTVREINVKLVNYLRAGAVVWIVDPDAGQVDIYHPNQAPVTLSGDGIINGDPILPGFQLAVKDIFPAE